MKRNVNNRNPRQPRYPNTQSRLNLSKIVNKIFYINTNSGKEEKTLRLMCILSVELYQRVVPKKEEEVKRKRGTNKNLSKITYRSLNNEKTSQHRTSGVSHIKI